MILEFASKQDLRTKLPPRLPFEGEARYLYLLKMRPARYTGTVKVGVTCNFAGRMNDCGWHGTIISIFSSLPLSDAKERERELVELGNSLCRRSWGSKDEEFWLRNDKLTRFIDAYLALADSPLQPDYQI